KGEIKKIDIMTFEEIKRSWQKSKMHPVEKNGDLKAGSVHSEFIVEMCRKTVINRTCKAIINSSSDKVLIEAVNRAELAEVEETAAADIEKGSNQTVIDIEPIDLELDINDPEGHVDADTSEYPKSIDPDF
ncbi:MAG: recombinase RecT, partial [Pseudomonadota bacterium]